MEKKITWRVERVSLSTLKPYDKNPRQHSKENLEKLKKAIIDLGYHTMVKANVDGTIAGGHLRLKALKELGFSEIDAQFPSRNLDDAEFKRLVVQDNVSFGVFDYEILVNDYEIEELIEWGLPNQDIVKTKHKVKLKEGLTDPESTPDLQGKTVCNNGDIWILGQHRLICGDSTSADVVKRLMGGTKPNLMVTDPPYGVEYDPSWRDEFRVNNSNKKGKVLNDDRADWSDAWSLFEGNIAYVWHAGIYAGVVLDSLVKCGFKPASQIIWAKDKFSLSRGDYHWQHEPCWYVTRGGHGWSGDRKQTTLWNIPAREDKGHGHGTQKPVECMLRPILNNSNEGQIVYDPFLGSGSTIIAAEKSNRVCYGVELSQNYCDVIIRRWQDFTGNPAKLEDTGQTFSEVENATQK